MTHACCGGSERQASRRIPVRLRVADLLALSAAPTFAIMAMLSFVPGGGPAQMLCSAANVSPLSGMTTMYVLMSAFHAGPWLKLVGAGARRPV